MASAEVILRNEFETWLSKLGILLTPTQKADLLDAASTIVQALNDADWPLQVTPRVRNKLTGAFGHQNGTSVTPQRDGTTLSQAIIHYADGTIVFEDVANLETP